MKRQAKLIIALFAFLIVPSQASETEKGVPDYYRPTLTETVQKKVERVLENFKLNMEAYYRRTRGSGMKMTTTSAITSEAEIVNLTGKETQEELKTIYNHLEIPVMKDFNLIKKLPIRRQPINTVGNLQGKYEIEGETFERQNVSGVGMDCFFNSVGLKRADEVEKLKDHCNNPIVRYMIASDARSTALNTADDNIIEKIQNLIDYSRFARQQTEIIRKPITGLEKNKIFKRNREDLTIRATSLEAFSAFLNYINKPNVMVACISNVPSELSTSTIPDLAANSSYTSIDAIAYLNKFGIKIYHEENGPLELYHQFIPANATEIAYVYHSGIHFEALMPLS